jgi:hypothetical protein
MGLLGFLRGGLKIDDLAARLGCPREELLHVPIAWRSFEIPKRGTKGTRRILAPDPALKRIQKLLLRRVFARLRAHPAAMGFEPGRSIVMHAALHAGCEVVVGCDLRDFFESTAASRVRTMLRRSGWNRAAAARLTELCTHEDHLPQGAPTSPRLSNLVNVRLDARLSGLARSLGGTYSRYADDLAFSFRTERRGVVGTLLGAVNDIVRDEGYLLNRRKQRVLRRHQQQRITGLVVNERVALPRGTRRWLRAVEHHFATGRPATLEPHQMVGWDGLRYMILVQRDLQRTP